jgi:hypothetical protein
MLIGGSTDVEDVARVSVRDLSPSLRCVTGNGGVLSIKESPRITVPSGNHRRGEGWHGANNREPSLMSREIHSSGRDATPGRQG